jgi:glycogen synthase
MRVLMLGWEYPPHITGGLGNACRGLARALGRQGIHVRFVMPRPDSGTHDNDGLDTVLIDPAQPTDPSNSHAPDGCHGSDSYQTPVLSAPLIDPLTNLPTSIIPPLPHAVHVWQIHMDAPWHSVYPGGQAQPPPSPTLPATPPTPAPPNHQAKTHAAAILQNLFDPSSSPSVFHPIPETRNPEPGSLPYPSDAVAGARAFADAVLQRLIDEPFDLIHANDWVTFPAALALGKAWGVPVVLHVHSLERDRSPLGENPAIREIEASSVAMATAIIAVSRHTRLDLINQYGLNPDRAFVVYNGVELASVWANLGQIHRDDQDRLGSTVLFLGRVTAQKGPLEFLRACAKVRQRLPRTFFVLAGDGDLLPECKALAHELGLSDQISFTGFLSPLEVQQTLDQADVLVVPSLSEPFGLVVLEAASRGVPTIVSHHAGVAEAMHHLVTCDPENTIDIADKILGVLKHSDMREELRIGARAELLRLSWDAGARRCLDVYAKALEKNGRCQM